MVNHMDWEARIEFYDKAYFTTRGGHFNDSDEPAYEPLKYKDKLKPLVDATGCRTVLDCGCSNGAWVHGFILQDPPVDAYGFDISEYAVSHVRAEIAERIIRADLSEKLPYEDKQFDLVLGVDILEHQNDYKRLMTAVKEMCRVSAKYIFLRQPMTQHALIGNSSDPSEVGRLQQEWVSELNVLPHKARLELVDVHPNVSSVKPVQAAVEHPNEHPRQFWVELFLAQFFDEAVLPDEMYLFPNDLHIHSFNTLLFKRTS